MLRSVTAKPLLTINGSLLTLLKGLILLCKEKNIDFVNEELCIQGRLEAKSLA